LLCQQRVTVLQFGVLLETGTDVDLELSISFHGRFCIALCTLVEMWLTTGADSDNARLWCKQTKGFQEMCTEKVDTVLGSEYYIAVECVIVYLRDN
jgi:hypothetical protein